MRLPQVSPWVFVAAAPVALALHLIMTWRL